MAIDLEAIKARLRMRPFGEWHRQALLRAAETDIPALIAEVERLRDENTLLAPLMQIAEVERLRRIETAAKDLVKAYGYNDVDVYYAAVALREALNGK